jgi:Methyltransferase FkbM domain
MKVQISGRTPRYLDVAANHARRWSNTYFYNRCHLWSGICVEPNPKYQSELSTQRTCRLVPKCMSDRESSVRFAFANAYGGVLRQTRKIGSTGVDAGMVERHPRDYEATKTITCGTLGGELPGRQQFDCMSLDMERFELPVLRGMNWERTLIDVIVVENRDKEVRDFLDAKGYDRFSFMKDDIYIRRGSGCSIDKKYVEWYKALDLDTGQIWQGKTLIGEMQPETTGTSD